MKRTMTLLKSVSLALLFGLTLVLGSSMRADDPNCNEQLARAQAMANQQFHDCIQPWQGNSFWELSVAAWSTTGVDGCTYQVDAWICPRCQPNQPCPKIACRVVATALVDANYNVTSVTCNL